MVQKEVKKKTSLYAVVAVLCAVVLVSSVYVFGTVPLYSPPAGAPAVGDLKTFSSNQQIIDYLNTNQQNQYGANWGPLDAKYFGSDRPVPGPMATGVPSSEGSYTLGIGDDAPQTSGVKGTDYSGTNIQVQGVDEADTVKTDGKYLYTISTSANSGVYYLSTSQNPAQDENGNSVYIINADPQNAHVESKISLGINTQPAGLFLSSDGQKLVVIASKYQTFNDVSRWESDGLAPMIMPAYQTDVYTYIYVYNVADKASPTLARNFTASGSYFNSRMIGDNVYAVVSQTAWVAHGLISTPVVYENQHAYDASPTSIYYADNNDSSYSFTSFYGLNVEDDNTAPTNMTVMMGGASTMYVSTQNIYITYPDWQADSGSYTAIYRVAINGLQLTPEAQGSVPGNTINQYSMDEYSGVFRVATNWWGDNGQFNNVYVLDGSLNVVGKLEGLAENENLHAVRFMGDKCYLVTYRQTDPLFVIDLSVPSNPSVLGELKIPGYSDYLHPYDETHLIGVGKDAVVSDTDTAYYQGLKLSLFDVSNVNSPVQLSNVTIGDRGSDSDALSDPHAFLFDKAKNLLVIPVTYAVVSDSDRQYGASAYGQPVWQGAYVYTLTLDGGFQLKGKVTHIDSQLLGADGNIQNPNDYYTTSNQWITRSLYVGNNLITVSNGLVKLNSLSDLSEVAAVPLS